jgi:hypothetical protein
MADQDRPAAAPHTDTGTECTTEWGVSWPGDPDQGGGVELRADEQDARRVAAMYRGSGALLVCSTVTITRSPWTAA